MKFTKKPCWWLQIKLVYNFFFSWYLGPWEGRPEVFEGDADGLFPFLGFSEAGIEGFTVGFEDFVDGGSSGLGGNVVDDRDVVTLLVAVVTEGCGELIFTCVNDVVGEIFSGCGGKESKGFNSASTFDPALVWLVDNPWPPVRFKVPLGRDSKTFNFIAKVLHTDDSKSWPL